MGQKYISKKAIAEIFDERVILVVESGKFYVADSKASLLEMKSVSIRLQSLTFYCEALAT